MANCPDGHPNPPHWEFCGECGAPIDTAAEELEAGRWYRTKWAIVGAGVARRSRDRGRGCHPCRYQERADRFSGADNRWHGCDPGMVVGRA